MRTTPKNYVAGQRACDSCGDLFQIPVGVWDGHDHLYCAKQSCNEAARNRPKSRYIEANTLKCSLRGCDNYIPEGSYSKLTRRLVCSVKCYKQRSYDTPSRMVTFKCASCGEEKTAPRSHGKGGRKFCNRVCTGKYKHEKTMAKSGIFRSIFDTYCATYVLDTYRGQSIGTHKLAVAGFLEFVQECGINSLDAVTPPTVSEYSKWGRANGNPNLMSEISHVKMFFDWQIATGMREKANPVVSSIHRKRTPKRKARPYKAEELAFIWELLHLRGNSRLRAEAAIAEESGMRREEIANIRLSDIDLSSHEIFVRTPNKTDTERTARFGSKAKAMISAWLADRDPNCGHDHLFHNSHGNPCNGIQMHLEFVKVLCKTWLDEKLHEVGIDSWSIHRMRHTMATRLAKVGPLPPPSWVPAAGRPSLQWKATPRLIRRTRAAVMKRP